MNCLQLSAEQLSVQMDNLKLIIEPKIIDKGDKSQCEQSNYNQALTANIDPI